MFRAVRDGADPTDKDREECKLATAVDRLLKRHIFLGLTGGAEEAEIAEILK